MVLSYLTPNLLEAPKFLLLTFGYSDTCDVCMCVTLAIYVTNGSEMSRKASGG